MYAASQPNTMSQILACGCTYRFRESRPEYLNRCRDASLIERRIKDDGDIWMRKFEEHYSR